MSSGEKTSHSHLAGRLLIADTNNSVIRYLDMNDSGAELFTLELNGVMPPAKSKSPKRLRRRSLSDTLTILVDGVSSEEGNLYLKFSVPEEYHFSKVSTIIRPDRLLLICLLLLFNVLLLSKYIFIARNIILLPPVIFSKCRKLAVNSL